MIKKDIKITVEYGEDKVYYSDNIESYSEETHEVTYVKDDKADHSYDKYEKIRNVSKLEFYENGEWVVVFEYEKPIFELENNHVELKKILRSKNKLSPKILNLESEIKILSSKLESLKTEMKDLDLKEERINKNIEMDHQNGKLIWKSIS